MTHLRYLTTLLIVSTMTTACSNLPGKTADEFIQTATVEHEHSQAKRRLFMIGRWYGHQDMSGGGSREQLMTRYADGTYEIVFRMLDDAEKEFYRKTETGMWGIAGPVYFTIYLGVIDIDPISGQRMLSPADRQHAMNYDAYRIIDLTDERFRYESYNSGSVYEIRKVPDDFDLEKLDKAARKAYSF